MSNPIWGASQDDWQALAALGLTNDLLPVVSNPDAPISPSSTMKALGKTPSLYNADRKVVGIKDWTNKQTHDSEVARWSRNSDYGICIQTRRVRGLDIDVDDQTLSDSIAEFVCEFLLEELPRRTRANSGKCLLPIIIDAPEGTLSKRSFPVQGGIVEFLADGQQFIAVGTHPSVERYRWGVDGMLPTELVTIDLATFNALWDDLVSTFATGESLGGGVSRKRRVGGGDSKHNVLSCVDETADVLESMDVMRGKGRNGEIYIHCPWATEHSSDSGMTETTYFRKGSNGYEQGHFKCLHAHCTSRTDADFIAALGIFEQSFDVVSAEDDGEAERERQLDKAAAARARAIVRSESDASLERELDLNDEGKILATVSNLRSILLCPAQSGTHIAYDTFRDEIVCRAYGSAESAWIPLRDNDYMRMRIELERTGFLKINSGEFKDVVRLVGELNTIDTAMIWANSLVWDGFPRVASFLEQYMGVEDSEYTTAVSEYIWAALAGRAVSPGCKADAAPIFVGEQYIGKSFAIAAMVSNPRLFAELKLDDNEDNLARKMRGKLIAELAELRGLHTKELEGIKAFITRQFEEWTPKYMEFVTVYPRRLLFIGTSNKEELFADETGNRRWLPVTVTKADIDGIVKDRDQLWAEGVEMFKDAGWSTKVFYEKANGLAHSIRENFMVSDSWETKISEYLYTEGLDGKRPIESEELTTISLLNFAIGMESKQVKKYDEIRVGKIMKKFGFVNDKILRNGVRKRVWMMKKG